MQEIAFPTPSFTQSVTTFPYQNEFFSLDGYIGEYSTELFFLLHTPTFTTEDLPLTVPLLKKHLPSILKCRCFNNRSLPFSEEVKNTEVAHLYEHILLEYLCDLKLSPTTPQVSFKGETRWNWRNDPFGAFRIAINIGTMDQDILHQAIEKANVLMLKIYNEYNQTQWWQFNEVVVEAWT